MSGSNSPVWQQGRILPPAQQGVVQQLVNIGNSGRRGTQQPARPPQLTGSGLQNKLLDMGHHLSNVQTQEQLLHVVARQKELLEAAAAKMNVLTQRFQPTVWELQQKQAPPRPNTPAPTNPVGQSLANIDTNALGASLQQIQAVLGMVHANFQNAAAGAPESMRTA